MDHPDLQGPPDLQDRLCTSRQEMEEVFQAEQDSRGPLVQKETKGSQVLQDMHLRERKENRASSWGLMGDLCTSEAYKESRATQDSPAQRDLQVRMVLQVQRGRSVYQADRVDQD